MTAPASPKRVLITIPHYFNPEGNQQHGSTRRDPQPRIQALARCLLGIHQSLGNRQGVLQIGSRSAHPANETLAAQVDVIVCTVGGKHLLDHMAPFAHLFHHERTETEPMLLGFECHRVLRDRLGDYDVYAFMEDDLIVSDPLFLAKIRWFEQLFGPSVLLQPNRFELSHQPSLNKLYIDGDLRKGIAEAFNPFEGDAELAAEFLGMPLRFRRAMNPHSGGFFLSAEQMRRWVAQPYFLDRDSRFIGPLESAAGLGVMRTFKTYKTAPSNAGFLEIQHEGRNFLALVGQSIPFVDQRLP